MALNGVFYGTTNNQFIKPKIVWSAVQSQEGNWSDVTATLYYSRTNSGYVTESNWIGSITIDGVVLSGSKYVSISYESNTEAITNTVRVYHDSYGEKSLTISASGYTYGTTHESTTISQEIQLDTIARESTIGASDGYIGSAITISVKQRNQAYTHSVEWAFGALSGYISADWELADQEEKLTDTSISITLPELFYAQIPDAQEGICTLTCRTYSADVQIGSNKTCTFRVMTRESECAPAVTGTVVDVNEKTLALTGDEKILVQGFSAALCTIAATAKNGASIAQRQIAGTAVAEGTLMLEAFAESSVTFQAVDGRQYSGAFTCPVQLIPYVKLSLVASCQRTDPTSGKCELVLSGQYFAGSFGAQDNALEVECQINSEDPVLLAAELTETGYQLTATLTGLDYTKSHKVTVTATDKLMSVQQTMTVKKGIPVFDWGQKDFAFHVPVHANAGLQVAGKPLWEHIYPVGAIYMSVNETDPAELFGGTWERIKDSFLLSSGEVYTPGTNGGKAEHTLTNEELPANMGQFAAMRWPEDLENGIVSATQKATNTAFSSASWDYGTGIYTLSGGGQAHNNMPPYLAVYVWKRVA